MEEIRKTKIERMIKIKIPSIILDFSSNRFIHFTQNTNNLHKIKGKKRNKGSRKRSIKGVKKFLS
jgi:hypothetical protein